MQALLSEEGFDNDAAFDGAIKKLEANLKKTKKKDGDGDDMEVRAYHAAQMYIPVLYIGDVGRTPFFSACRRSRCRGRITTVVRLYYISFPSYDVAG